MMPDNTRAIRRMRLVMLLMAVAVLVPSLYGFGTKFLEFVAIYRGDVEGAFAISPILNYLLASLGFLCLFAWAVTQGMFRDIERPKYTLLENEARLDADPDWLGDRALYERAHADPPWRRSGLTSDRNRVGGFYDHD
jgi:hypothetical protein